MARLPYADTQSAPSTVRERLERNPVAVLRMLAHAESVFVPWVDYTGALLGRAIAQAETPSSAATTAAIRRFCQGVSGCASRCA